jgi:hypothetical protein
MIAARTLCAHASFWLSRPDSREDDSEPEDDHHQGDDHESDDEEYRMIMNQMAVSHRHSKRKATENAAGCSYGGRETHGLVTDGAHFSPSARA